MTATTFHALVFWFPAFLFSTTVHEAAHAWAALHGGDDTAARGGQASLAPWPHIRRAPFGMLVVPLLTSLTQGWTIGWASAPYDPEWAERHPRRAALMAAAGPLANLGLAVAAFALLRLGLVFGVFDAPARITLDVLVEPAAGADPLGVFAFAALALSVLFTLNVLLFVLNMLPFPPLDGASVLTLAMPPRAASAARTFITMPGMSFVGILAVWKFFPVLSEPVLKVVIALLHPGQY
ncbi:MAG: site-2 protease family protein [Candidatus Eisenbacteria bacterium]|nr:site-2 protease family protein [Candidatus Eisenbacteria bacterium]